MKSLLAVILLALLLINTSSTLAQGFGKGEGLIAGIGIVIDHSVFIGPDDEETQVFPYLAYEWENARLGIDGFSWQFVESNENKEINLIVEPRWSIAKADDIPEFEYLDRGTAFEAGFSAELRSGRWFIGGKLLLDVSSTHDGFENQMEVGIREELLGIEGGISVGVSYTDSKLSNHLYGISASESRDDLISFKPGDQLYPWLSLSATLGLGEHSGLVSFASLKFHDKDLMDSPLVDSKREWSVGLAFMTQLGGR